MNKNYQLSQAELRTQFEQKYGDPETTGWSPRRRYKFGYYLAGDVYEAFVNKLVNKKTKWIDVGGGTELFPNNPNLSLLLSERCETLVAVDPSPNIEDNIYCDESEMCMFEDYSSSRKFNLATFRMVAEHVDNTQDVLRKLNEIMEPNGLVVIYTINKYCPVPLITKFTPFSIHFRIKKLIWGGEEEDTFPVVYKMNTRKSLDSLFSEFGFVEDNFQYLDDLSVFLKFKSLSYMELLLWKVLSTFNIRYPEHNLLGVYRKLPE